MLHFTWKLRLQSPEEESGAMLRFCGNSLCDVDYLWSESNLSREELFRGCQHVMFSKYKPLL